MELKNLLQTKLGAALEILLFFAVAMSTFQLGIIIPILVVLAIGSLKVRKLKYSDIGLNKTDFNLMKIILGLALAFFYFALFHYLIDPVLSKHMDSNLPKVFDIKGNIPQLIISLIVSWTIAAIGEEIIFRGYLINRLIDLIGESLPVKILIVVFAGITFGFVHYYQGIHGIIAAGLIGMFQSIIYLANQKKLVIPIIAHGAFDSIGFVILFLG
jgi:membrane protease YdiL (CAAX protease family)